MADILPINTWFCFDFVSSVHRVPFNNVQLQVYIIKIKIVLYTQLSQLSHISLELSKHNIINMCVILCTSGKKCFFHIISQKKCALGKTPLLPLGHAQSAFIDQRFPNMIQRLFADVIHDAIWPMNIHEQKYPWFLAMSDQGQGWKGYTEKWVRIGVKRLHGEMGQDRGETA